MQLVIQKPGTFITQKDEIFRLKNKEAKLDVSPLKVESIVITNKASITSQAVVLALEHNIDVIFLDGFGFPLGRIWFAKTGSTAMIRNIGIFISCRNEKYGPKGKQDKWMGGLFFVTPLIKPPPFARTLRQAAKLNPQNTTVFLRFKFLPSLISDEIEHFITASYGQVFIFRSARI